MIVRAERSRTHRTKKKDKRYAPYASEMECVGLVLIGGWE